VCSYYYYY